MELPDFQGEWDKANERAQQLIAEDFEYAKIHGIRKGYVLYNKAYYEIPPNPPPGGWVFVDADENGARFYPQAWFPREEPEFYETFPPGFRRV